MTIHERLGGAILAALMALPVAATAATHSGTRPADLDGYSIAWCGDVEDVEVDLAIHGVAPAKVLRGPQRKEVKLWAKARPGFEELYRDDSGRTVAAFSQDVDARQAEIDDLFAGKGVVAVEFDFTRKDLRRLQERVVEALLPLGYGFGAGARNAKNVVMVLLPELRTDSLDVLEAEFLGAPICVDGPDSSTLPEKGPQRWSGDGWRLLGRDMRSPGWPTDDTGIARDPAQLQVLWDVAGMHGARPRVDFQEEAALWFTASYSSGCTNRRLDEVIFDEARSVVYPIIVDPTNPGPCRLDLAGAWHFFVAVPLDRLPDAPFEVWLEEFRRPQPEAW